MPPSPITDFLAGAVWLVRRTLFPADIAGVSADPATEFATGLASLVQYTFFFPGAGVPRCVYIKNDCSNRNLTGIWLDGGTLRRINFSGANLSNSAFTSVDLAYSNFSGANLTNVDMKSYAGLSPGTNLTGANLTGATLTGSNLSEVNLTGAILTGAILTGVKWSNTTCPDGSVTSSGCAV